MLSTVKSPSNEKFYNLVENSRESLDWYGNILVGM